MKDLFELLEKYAHAYAAGDVSVEEDFIRICYECVVKVHRDRCLPLEKKYGTANMDLEEFCWGVTETAYKSISLYKPEYSFGGWLYVIGLNEFRAKYRSCKKHDTLSLEEMLIAEGEETATPRIGVMSTGEDIEREFLRREALRILREGIELLPDNRRLAITGCYLEGKKRKQAAEELDVTETALNNHLSRGSDDLEDYCYEKDIAEDLLFEPDI